MSIYHKTPIPAGSLQVRGKTLVGHKSGIAVSPLADGTVQIVHYQGEGEDQRKITLSIHGSKSEDSGEDIYELTSTICKTRYLEDGDELEEMDEVKTRRRLTARGSVYISRDSKVARTLRNLVGHEFVDEQITNEIEEESVSRGESKHDKVTQRTMLQNIANGISEDEDETRKNDDGSTAGETEEEEDTAIARGKTRSRAGE